MVVIAIPSLRLGGLKEFLSAKFGKSDSFTFLTIEDNAVKEVKVIQNPPMGEDGGFGIVDQVHRDLSQSSLFDLEAHGLAESQAPARKPD